jgi:hypothetical protein
MDTNEDYEILSSVGPDKLLLVLASTVNLGS